jgi:hypothetical protein
MGKVEIAIHSGARPIMERFPETPDSGTLLSETAFWDWQGAKVAALGVRA